MEKTELDIGARLTAKGKIAVDEYLKVLADEKKEDKRWKYTSLVAWVGIAISIAALLVAIFKG